MKPRINIDFEVVVQDRLRLKPLVLILLALMGTAFVIAMIRYANGIGAISNLSNSYPWGFWISFDLFTGVAISSGGFLMAGAIYILQLKQFKPLLRPSVLTAFLGYIMVVVALLVRLASGRLRVAAGGEPKDAVEARVRRALAAAEKYSLVANSVKSKVTVDAQIEVVA